MKNENCYTITTAHQPNIFTGPLYVIYKILHTIKLAETLQKKYSDKSFVPVFFMGSEDADLDELGNLTIQNKKLSWQTKQTGAVGRMIVDQDFLRLVEEIKGQIAVSDYGSELSDIFSSTYTKGKTIQQATFELINVLFKEYGLLVLIPDDKSLKQEFIPLIKKEITSGFSQKIVEETNQNLSKQYKTQAFARPINLFYLIDDKRERIEKIGNDFFVNGLDIKFSEQEILNEVENFPERFSPNVILRPVFQEAILPNIAFIGGGGELAYWLQLKNVFTASNIDYPVLILRNSFLLLSKKQELLMNNLDLTVVDFFNSEDEIKTQYVKAKSEQTLNYTASLNELHKTFETLISQAKKVDNTLVDHLKSIEVNTIKKINAAEKKLVRAEKRKFEDQQLQIQKLKEQLFPKNSLQERVENFSFYYSKYGKELFDILLKCSLSVEQEFTTITIED